MRTTTLLVNLLASCQAFSIKISGSSKSPLKILEKFKIHLALMCVFFSNVLGLNLLLIY